MVLKNGKKMRTIKPKMKGGNGGANIASQCPPGAFCIENLTLGFILLLLAIVGYCVYSARTVANTMFGVNSPLNTLNMTPFQHAHNNLPPHGHTGAEMQNHLLFNVASESMYDMLRPIARPGIATSSNPKDTLLNPYAPPLQSNQPHAYKQIGYLKNDAMGHQMFPLFAKPQHIRRDKWYYYTIYDNIKLPVFAKGRKCSSETGCDSLMNGDVIQLENMPGNFIVSTYDNETLVYDPVVF